MLRLSAGSLLAAGLWPGSLLAGDGKQLDDFHFVVVNDLHFLDQRCMPWFERLIKQMKARTEKLDFCLVVGDLAEHGKINQLEPIRAIFKTLGLPVYVVIGNHDYIGMDECKPFMDLFPTSVNYHFEHAGWQFVGLDSSHGMRPKVAVQPHTLRWLDDTLPRLDKKKPMVVFTHFPLGPLVIYRATNADQVLDRLKEFNLQAVYSGHFHGFTERHVRGTTLTTNRCCSFSRSNHDGTKEKGFFVCRAKDGKVERAFVVAS
jgi:predicted MPP superfamily phosphohydrolase